MNPILGSRFLKIHYTPKRTCLFSSLTSRSSIVSPSLFFTHALIFCLEIIRGNSGPSKVNSGNQQQVASDSLSASNSISRQG